MFVSHFLPGPEHCVIIEVVIRGLAVIISLVLRLDPSDGQRGCAASLGARELIQDPRGLIAITIDDSFKETFL